MPLGNLPVRPHMVHAAADETGLRSEIIRVVRFAADNAPRSLQRRVGPSEVGTPCARQLGYKVSDHPPAPGRDTMHDPWPSILGTATHAWLAEAFELANVTAEREGKAAPWHLEQRVDVGLGLNGSCDCFHEPSGVVLDWKILGDTQYRKYTTEGPSETYRVQAHCYGLGWLRAGYVVNRVGIGFFGRAKKLSDLHIWSEPFDLDVALRALKRLRTVQQLVASGVEPTRLPIAPGGACYFCQFRGRPEDGFCSAQRDGNS